MRFHCNLAFATLLLVGCAPSDAPPIHAVAEELDVPEITDSDKLEIIFRAPAGDHFRFEVQGLTCPEADEDWYRAQLNVAISVCVGSSREECSLVMFSDNFHRFKAQLKTLMSGEIKTASLETGDYLHVHVWLDDGICNVSLQTDPFEREDFTKFQIVIDYTSLDSLFDAVTRVSDRYTTWSVPRQ